MPEYQWERKIEGIKAGVIDISHPLIIHHLKFLWRKKEKASQTLPFGTAIRRGI